MRGLSRLRLEVLLIGVLLIGAAAGVALRRSIDDPAPPRPLAAPTISATASVAGYLPDPIRAVLAVTLYNRDPAPTQVDWLMLTVPGASLISLRQDQLVPAGQLLHLTAELPLTCSESENEVRVEVLVRPEGSAATGPTAADPAVTTVTATRTGTVDGDTLCAGAQQALGQSANPAHVVSARGSFTSPTATVHVTGLPTDLLVVEAFAGSRSVLAQTREVGADGTVDLPLRRTGSGCAAEPGTGSVPTTLSLFVVTAVRTNVVAASGTWRATVGPELARWVLGLPTSGC